MNLWAARKPAARAEAGITSSVANWFISTKSSGPVNGEVQDSILGLAEATRSAVRVDRYHAMALFARTGEEPPRFDADAPGALLAGRELASRLLAAAPVNYSRPPTSANPVYAPFIPLDPSETLTVIERGRLARGVLDKAAVGPGAAGGVFHLVSREFGPQRALDMIFALQQFALQFLLFRGFTVGVADLLPPPAALAEIRALVARVAFGAGVITDRLLRGEVVPPLGSTVRAFYEAQMRESLKVPEGEILRWILGTIRPQTNGFFRMIATGAKGNNPNFIHVSGAIQQTTINGERILEQFAFRRTHPYFPRYATDPAAYGFVANSYITGMRTSEFIFQDMNGRFDLINKALSTAATGYFMRKGVMNNQSAVVDNLRRVTKDFRLVQVLAGEDGLDARELERVEFATVLLGDAALREATWVDVAGAGAAGDAAALAAAQGAVDGACARVRADRDAFRAIFMRVQAANFRWAFTTRLLMPVNVGRIVKGVFLAAADAGGAPPPLAAAGLAARVARVADLCERLPYALLNELQERRRAPVPPHLAAATFLLAMLVRAELCPRVLARLSDEQLGFVAEAVRHRYHSSLIDYGTAVGLLAAQAISEPLTQYMLNSHHRSVAGGTNKAGLVRVSEIYGARPVAAEQSAAMLVPLRAAALPADPAAALAVAQAVANSFEHVTLRYFTRQYDVLLEPYGALLYPPYAGDAAWVAEFERNHPLVSPPGDLTNWCCRFVLDKGALVLKAVELELIVRRLRDLHQGGFYVVHTAEAVPEVVVRVWLRAGLFRRGAEGDEDLAVAACEEALGTAIRGIRGITGATVERVPRARVAPDGSLAEHDTLAIATTGTNLYHACLNAAVDTTAIVSSSVGDTLALLGIEAASAKVVSETVAFMEGDAPNLRHLYLYAAEMSRTGRITSIERGGLSAREHDNVLLRMAYGDPINAVQAAALASSKNRVYGIAAPQLLGAPPQVGTLYSGCECVVDEAFVRANMKTVDSVLDSL